MKGITHIDGNKNRAWIAIGDVETAKRVGYTHNFTQAQIDAYQKSIQEPEPTEEELQTQQIIEAKRYLNDTDYKALKAFEGDPSADWEEIKQKRQEARTKIRELEA